MFPGRRLQRRRGLFSSNTSLDSGSEASLKKALPKPTSLQECDELTELQHKSILQRSSELVKFSELLKNLRSKIEPLLLVKQTLQDEIILANKHIDVKSDEVIGLKNKLRHHSEKQIQNNIDRLELQLRVNNFRPKEEQKILDEISFLRRSFKTLKEFNLKQIESNKYRSERYRLIDERNRLFSKIHALVTQEDEIRRGIIEYRDDINNYRKVILHLKELRPALEGACLKKLKADADAKKKKLEEKALLRKEASIKIDEKNIPKKISQKICYVPYEKEKNICKQLISYLQSISNTKPSKTSFESKSKSNNAMGVSTIEVSSSSSLLSPPLSPLDGSQGSYYAKPIEEASPYKSKKNKAQAKRESKVNKERLLSHSADVIASFAKLETISIPKTSKNIPPAIEALKEKICYYDRATALEHSISVQLDWDILNRSNLVSSDWKLASAACDSLKEESGSEDVPAILLNGIAEENEEFMARSSKVAVNKVKVGPNIKAEDTLDEEHINSNPSEDVEVLTPPVTPVVCQEIMEQVKTPRETNLSISTNLNREISQISSDNSMNKLKINIPNEVVNVVVQNNISDETSSSSLSPKNTLEVASKRKFSPRHNKVKPVPPGVNIFPIPFPVAKETDCNLAGTGFSYASMAAKIS